MPILRRDHQERRRRAVREATSADAEAAIEGRRRRLERRLAGRGLDDEDHRRDPGYSQHVRYACGQRVVQLIPLRPAAISAVMAAIAAVAASLIAAHWFVHYRGSPLAATYLGHLFHLRSPHSIAHWLGTQAWFVTAIMATLTFQLRRHRLDDYQARYRIWGYLAAGAALASFESATSALYLFGSSIDGWTQREIGYRGWPLVLAAFSSGVAAVGVRLCSEIKSSPLTVAAWLSGLLCWGASAALAAGLFRLDVSPAALEMTIGGLWLTGLLTVVAGSLWYLRATYIEAQQRFILRNKWLQRREDRRRKRRENEGKTSDQPSPSIRDRSGRLLSTLRTKAISKVPQWPRRSSKTVDGAKAANAAPIRKRDEGLEGGYEKIVPASDSEKSYRKGWFGRRRDTAQDAPAGDHGDRTDANVARSTASKPSWLERRRAARDAKLAEKQRRAAEKAEGSKTSDRADDDQPTRDRTAQKAAQAAEKKRLREEAAAEKQRRAEERAHAKAAAREKSSSDRPSFASRLFSSFTLKRPESSPEATANDNKPQKEVARVKEPNPRPSQSQIPPVRPTSVPKPSTDYSQIDDDDDGDGDQDASSNSSKLSRAERKRLRRQNRAA